MTTDTRPPIPGDTTEQTPLGVLDKDRLQVLLDWLDKDTVIVPDGPVDRVWSFRHMPRQRAFAVWIELVDWVEWLRGDYQLAGAVKGCWYRHTDVRNELLALMVAHRKTYRHDATATDYTADLTAWHTQWLWPCVTRMRPWFEDCSKDRCTLTSAPIPMYRDPTGDGVEEWIAADLADREDVAPVEDSSTDESESTDSERRRQPTMSGEDMARAYATGHAESLDMRDPDRLLRYENRDWELDRPAALYRRRPAWS